MITLDGITLNPDMVWEERYSSQSVEQTVRRTLGQVPVVRAHPRTAGQDITLSAREVNGMLIGMLRRSVVDLILVRAAVAGGQYVFSYNGENHSVIFRHHDGQAVNFVPLVAKTSYSASDLMRGEIKLMTV
jgi:hypothetical protein